MRVASRRREVIRSEISPALCTRATKHAPTCRACMPRTQRDASGALFPGAISISASRRYASRTGRTSFWTGTTFVRSRNCVPVAHAPSRTIMPLVTARESGRPTLVRSRCMSRRQWNRTRSADETKELVTRGVRRVASTMIVNDLSG